MRARDILASRAVLGGLLPSYEDRPGQLAMADAVERALEEDRHLFVEAGTGTGKTLAYLVPAVLSGRKVVISTATKALQEQIFTKDLPLVRELLGAHGVAVHAALMKGLANYVCRRRLQEAKSNDTATGDLARVFAWALETETGDRAELADLPEGSAAWQAVQSSTDTRIGSACNHYEECFVTRMRRDAEAAQIVVVNHHLFLADLALRHARAGEYGSAIPPYDAVIFDEAHQLEEIATEFFGMRVSSARVDAFARDAERTLVSKGLLTVLGTGEARPLLVAVRATSEAFFAELYRIARAGPRDTRKFLEAKDLDAQLDEAHAKLDGALAGIEAYASVKSKEEAVFQIAGRARELRSDLRHVLRGARAQDSEWAPAEGAQIVWIDCKERSVALGASPIDVGPTLREALYERVPSVVCTSATLTAGLQGGIPSFHFAKAHLGAPPEAEELVVASPFDFAARAALYVASDLPEPTAPGFDDAAAERVRALLELTGGGAFVLCTSLRSMHAMHRALKGRAHLLVQGESPKHLLLSRFRSARDAVLVATMSFWEGVDVPGDALRLVILDKIPFAVPTDPLVMARNAYIERHGGNPFTEYAVPAAAITLKQGFGRLIRTKDDAGIVALLDRRAVAKGYGKRLLSTLPPARRLASLAEVDAFCREVGLRRGMIQEPLVAVSP